MDRKHELPYSYFQFDWAIITLTTYISDARRGVRIKKEKLTKSRNLHEFHILYLRKVIDWLDILFTLSALSDLDIKSVLKNINPSRSLLSLGRALPQPYQSNQLHYGLVVEILLRCQGLDLVHRL